MKGVLDARTERTRWELIHREAFKNTIGTVAHVGKELWYYAAAAAAALVIMARPD